MIDWRVSDKESLSDHRYIQFQAKSDWPMVLPWRNSRSTQWDVYYADLEKKLQEHIIEQIQPIILKMRLHSQKVVWRSRTRITLKKERFCQRRGHSWWHPQMEKMQKQCRRNIPQARRHQRDWDTTKTDRTEYKMTTHCCRRVMVSISQQRGRST